MDDLVFSCIALSISCTAFLLNILCIMNKRKSKKKSLCDSCVYCIQKINCGNYTKYFASSKCPFRFDRDYEVDQHLGNIEFCDTYKRRNI